jgi:hypothetical protein
MSGAELHMISSHPRGATRAAAERGELRFPLPGSSVQHDEGQTIIDPDEEVRDAIADLSCAFEQTSSAYGGAALPSLLTPSMTFTPTGGPQLLLSPPEGRAMNPTMRPVSL